MSNKTHVKIIAFDDRIDDTLLLYINHSKKQCNLDTKEEECMEERLIKLSDNAEPYKIFHFFASFVNIYQNMAWTTGTKLFQKFPMHLLTQHCNTCDQCLKEVLHKVKTCGSSDSVLVLKLFQETLLNGYEYKEQIDYLQSIKKPAKMDPGKFLLRLQVANTLVCQFPNAPKGVNVESGFNKAKMKRLYVKAMPKKWGDNFDDKNLRTTTMSLVTIKHYTTKQAVKDPFVVKDDKNKNLGNNLGNNSGYNAGNNLSGSCDNKGGCGNRNSQGGYGGHGGNNSSNYNSGNNLNNLSNNSRSGRRIATDDPCPLLDHGSHTWEQCQHNCYQQNTNQSNNN